MSAASSLAQTATVTLDEVYPSSYKATVTLTNDTTAAIGGWLTTIQLGGPISSHWNANIEADEGDPATFLYGISNAAHNATLAPGATTTFGFVVNPDNGTTPPATALVEGNWPPPPPFPDPNYILYETVDGFPSGPKDDDAWLDLWPGTEWVNGPDEGRVAIDDAISFDGAGKSIDVLYPQGGQKPGQSGAQWFMNFGPAHDELYMSYWVRFDEDFDFVIGGKLPGLGGANSFADRTNEWSGRLMWREAGKAEFYIHVPVANDHDPGIRFWWNTEGFQATFVPGRWHHIELHFRLNTPGLYDGLMEGWFDGVKAADYPGFYFRDALTTNTATIAWGFFSTFFGGSSSSIWEATKDEHARFDKLTISKARIGYPGLPADVDSDGMPNTWEITHFGTDTGALSAGDSDGDGQPDQSEYVAGTDPNDLLSHFLPTFTWGPNRNIAANADGKAGRTYRLERSTDLDEWEEIDSTGLLAADSPISLSATGTDLRFFYRVTTEFPD